MTITKNHNLIAIQNGKPTTPDPLLGDTGSNMDFYNSVRLSLVTNSRLGEITPLIAQSWSSSDNDTIWNVVINEDLRFEDGSFITATEVYLSIKRIIILTNRNDSYSNIINYIESAKKLKALSDNIPGIILNKNTLTFKLIKPIPNFLELISSPILAIVSSKDYDAKTLIWKDPKKVNASGYYKVAEIHSTYGVLEKRTTSLWNQINYKTPDKITIYWNDKTIKDPIDLYPYLTIKAPSQLSSNLKNFVKDVDDRTLFFRILNWNVKDHPTNHKSTRKNLRDFLELIYSSSEFQNTYYREHIRYTRSFLGEQITPLKPLQPIKDNDELIKTVSILKNDFQKHPLKINSNYPTNSQAEQLISYLAQKLTEYNINHELISDDINNAWFENRTQELLTDITLINSNISLTYPVDDLKFMFFSKESLAHPDFNDEMKKMLYSNHIDYNIINEFIWEQAIFIPILQFEKGYKFSDNINISRRNTLVDGFPWQLIEIK